MDPYILLMQLLASVETQLHIAPSVDALTDSLPYSSVHLQRLFRFAFGMPLATYIRKRRLAKGMEALLKTRRSVLDIALDCGFEYEQSFIRAFKREFGMTPGDLRKRPTIVPVTAPFRMTEAECLNDGVLFKPEMVMVPGFFAVGKRHTIRRGEDVALPPIVAKQFWAHERPKISNALHPEVYIGLTQLAPGTDAYNHYLPSLQVKDLSHVPDGLEGISFPTSLCAHFRYIGRHHYDDINADRAQHMYKAILSFASDPAAQYRLFAHSMYFERIDTSAYDGTYCVMEWYTPVREKEA